MPPPARARLTEVTPQSCPHRPTSCGSWSLSPAGTPRTLAGRVRGPRQSTWPSGAPRTHALPWFLVSGGSPHVHPGLACVHTTSRAVSWALRSQQLPCPALSAPVLTANDHTWPGSPAQPHPLSRHPPCPLLPGTSPLMQNSTCSTNRHPQRPRVPVCLCSCHRLFTKPTGLRHGLDHGGRGSSVPRLPSWTRSTLGLARTHQQAPRRRRDEARGASGAFVSFTRGTC